MPALFLSDVADMKQWWYNETDIELFVSSAKKMRRFYYNNCFIELNCLENFFEDIDMEYAIDTHTKNFLNS